MSLLTSEQRSPATPQTRFSIRRIAARISGSARTAFGPIKPYIESAAAILFFTALGVVLLDTKAAVMLSRMHY